MRFAQQRNRLTTHFSERIPVAKRRMTVCFISNTRTLHVFNRTMSSLQPNVVPLE